MKATSSHPSRPLSCKHRRTAAFTASVDSPSIPQSWCSTSSSGRYGIAWPYDRQCPTYQVARDAGRRRQNSIRSRDFPISGSPIRATTWPCPARPRQAVVQQRQLTRPPHEGTPEPWVRAQAAHWLLDEAPDGVHGDGGGDLVAVEGPAGLTPHLPAHQLVGRRAHEDHPRGSPMLEARG
jgi:hypothetical protein